MIPEPSEFSNEKTGYVPRSLQLLTLFGYIVLVVLISWGMAIPNVWLVPIMVAAAIVIFAVLR